MSMSKTEPPTRRSASLWLAGSVAGVGALLMVSGIGLSRQVSYAGQVAALQSFAIIVIAVALVFAAVIAWHKYRDQLALINQFDPSSGDGQEIPPQMATPDMPRQAMGNNAVMRLLIIVAELSEHMVPMWDTFEFETDGSLSGYGFRSIKPGVLASESMKNRINERLMSAVAGDGWNIGFDSKDDTFTATLKSDVPKLALPPMYSVVQSASQAAAEYNDFKVVIGEGADGPISFRPKLFPHREVVGSTGGGKSVAVRGELMQFLSAGFRLFLVDGKTTDYAPFLRFPNVSSVSTSLPEHIILIHKVWMVLQQRRQNSAVMAKQGDNSWRDKLTPVLIVLDEFASVRGQMSTTYKKELGLIENEISDLLKVGREFRVHVILATQDMKADTVKTDWLDMLLVRQSLGAPAPMTINKAFPEEIQGDVRRLGQRISREVPGRGLVAMTDDKGRNTAELYQSYFSYSPAESLSGAKGEVGENWRRFKEQVADRIPQIYPREWVKLEYPPEPDSGRDPYKDAREKSWVDLSQFTVKDLHGLEPILLEDPETFQPIPESHDHDPLSDTYLAQPRIEDGTASVFDV